MLGMRLCVMHNLYFYNKMMEEIRDALDKGEFKEYKKNKLSGFTKGLDESEFMISAALFTPSGLDNELPPNCETIKLFNGNTS